ncbi:DNTTIP1 [Acanthosepion pharaonis]|uniref:DNTTIP1 n=1 Tax=Acanthosepion pharaonis TaxID=158019 RepID=A0A812EIF0_ACAPH|nr:DNTTIP1 [Sepia pharaonis]
MMADRDLDHLPITDIADRDNALKRQVVIQVTSEGQDNRSVSPYFRKDQNEGLQQECGSEQPSKSFRSAMPPGQKHIFMTTPPKSNNQPFPLGHSSIKVQTTKQMAPPSKTPSPNSVGGTTRSVSPATRNISPAQVQIVTNHNNPPATEGILQSSNFLQVKQTQSPALIQALLQNRAPSPNQRLSPALISRNQEGFQQKIVVTPSVSPNRVVSATEPAHDGSSTIFITTDGNQIINQSAAQSQITSIPIVANHPSTQLFYMKKSPNVSQLSSQLKVQPLQGMQIKQDQLILNSIIVDKSQTASDKGIVSIQGTPSLLLSVPKANEPEQTLVGNEAGLRSSVYSPVMVTTQSTGPSIPPALLDQLTQARENITFTNITTAVSMPGASAVTQAPILAKRLAAPATSSITFSGQLPSGLRPHLVIPSTNANLLSTGLGSAPNVQLIPTSSASFANPSQLNILSVPNSQLPSLTLTENTSLLQQVTTAQPTSVSTQQRNPIVVSNVAVNIQPAMVTSNPQLVPSITERLPVASCSTSNSGNTSLLTSHPTLTERLTMTTNPSQAKISQQLSAATNCENTVTYSAVVASTPQLISAPVRTVRSEFSDLSTAKCITTQAVAPNPSGTNSQYLKIITPNVGLTQNQSGQVRKLVFTDHPEKSIPQSLKTGFQSNQAAMLVNPDNRGQHGFTPVKGDLQPQYVSMKPLSFEVASDSIRLIEVQGQPLKTTSIMTSTSALTPSTTASTTSSISNPVTSSNVNSLANPLVTAKTETVNALEYPKFSNAVLMPTLVEKINQVPITTESSVQRIVQSEMLQRAKQARSETIARDLDTSFPFPKVVPKESKLEPTKNAKTANKNDEVNPFFAQLRASAASSSFSSSLSTVGALPYKTFQHNSSTAFHGQASQLRRAVHSGSSSFGSFSNIDAAATNSQTGAYSMFLDSDRLSPSPPGFLSDIDQPRIGTSSEKQNPWDKAPTDKDQSVSNDAVKEDENETKGTSALKDDALSNNVNEKEPIPQPFSMRLQTLNNFPGNHGCKSTFRCHPTAINKAKVACITSTTKSLDLIRQNLQKFINKEIDQVIQEYIKKFFKPGIENIRFNNGSNAVSDEHMHSVCQKILEEAKKMYSTEKRSITPLRDIADNASDSGSTSGKRNTNRKRRMSETDLDVGLPVQKRRKKGRPPLHASGRVTPSKTIKQNEPVKREGPNWDPERLIPETLFVMGARANKALGFGATRGRLYIKHPELFKYSGDQDDKQWLFDHHHMPAIGGKAYILLYNDIQSLANTEEYRDNPNVILDELVYFTVPDWMMQKMKALMQTMRTDIPKIKNPTVSHAQHSNATNSTLPTEALSVTESNTSLALSSKLPFSTIYDDKPDSQVSPANSEVFEMLSVENNAQATDISPFVGGTLDEEGPSPSISDLDGLDEDTTPISTPFQLTASDPNS